MLRILHLEDDVIDAFLTEQAIQDAGIEAKFTVAKSRSEFFSALDQGRFNLILSDSGVLDLDGITALKTARQMYPHVSIICHSDKTNPAFIKDCFDAGATEFVSKGDTARLLKVLELETNR